jgi:pimeloyl-ACP methyl ester carboxylesterase
MLRRTISVPHTGGQRMHFPRRLAATSASVMLGLGVAALINTAMARNAERRNPPKGTFIEVDGVRLHYLEKGSGSPVVLLHGNQSMAEDFVISGVIDLLAKKYRVIAFDRPGFGYSERPGDTVWTPSAQADLISKALLRLGVEKSLMVGHSWGTLVALAYGLQHPAQTAAILLLSGYYFPTKRLDVVFASLPAIPIVGDILRYTVWPLLGWLAGPLLLKTIFAPAHVTERFKREFPFSMALRPSQIRATAGDSALMVPAAGGLSVRYRELTMPVAIMAGRGDKIVHIEPHPMRLHGLVRQSTLDVIDRGGHMLHHAHPEKIVAKVESLWAEMRPASDPEAAMPYSVNAKPSSTSA